MDAFKDTHLIDILTYIERFSVQSSRLKSPKRDILKGFRFHGGGEAVTPNGERGQSGLCVEKYAMSGYYNLLYETPHVRRSEQIERRTSNVQHRTSNIDGAALYRI